MGGPCVRHIVATTLSCRDDAPAASRPTPQAAAGSVIVTRVSSLASCAQSFPMRNSNLSPLDSAEEVQTAAS